jgi:hypothetical protein
VEIYELTGSWNWIQVPWQTMTTPIEMTPKIVTLVQCAYDLVPSSLVPSDHMISTFQQGHQTFPLVKLKDSISNILGHAYHSLLSMVPICLDHTFDQTPNFHLHTALIEQFHMMPSSKKHAVINMGRYHSYDESPNDYSFMDEDLGLTTDESDFDQCNFYYDLEELQEPADPSMMHR